VHEAVLEQPALEICLDLGDSLFFHAGGRDLVTSAIVSVERPPRDVIQQYAS
jgi:hypothetical protein